MARRDPRSEELRRRRAIRLTMIFNGALLGVAGCGLAVGAVVILAIGVWSSGSIEPLMKPFSGLVLLFAAMGIAGWAMFRRGRRMPLE